MVRTIVGVVGFAVVDVDKAIHCSGSGGVAGSVVGSVVSTTAIISAGQVQCTSA